MDPASADRREPTLVRAIGFWGLVALVINAVVGSGVFLLPSETFALLGPFSLWAPVLFALPVFVLVLCFAAAASHFDEPGGAFRYAGEAFGDFVGFETGWMNWLARISSLAALANGFVVSLARLWPPAQAPAARATLIVGTLGGLALVHALGVRYGAGTIYAFTLGKLVPLVVFIGAALVLLPRNPLPASLVLPAAGTRWGDAALFMLFAYAGFENVGVPAGEYRNPRRDLPLALLVGVLGIALLYALTQLAAMAVLPDLAATKTPIADAAAVLLGPSGAVLVTVGALVSMLGTNSGTVLEGSRMLYALALGRPRYRAVAAVHPRLRTPVVAIVLHVAVAIPLALLGSFAKLAMLSAVARLTTYLVTCAAVPRLMRRGPGFRVPVAVAILGVAISAVFFLMLQWRQFLAAVIALAVGGLLHALGNGRAVRPPAALTVPLLLVALGGCTGLGRGNGHHAAPEPDPIFSPDVVAGARARAQLPESAYLAAMLTAHPGTQKLMADAANLRMQVVLGVVDETTPGHPRLVQHGYRVGAEYFYPASSVKLFGAVAALERLAELRAETGLAIDARTPLVFHPLFEGETLEDADPTNLDGGKITVEHEIRKIFLVSDNQAFNHLYELVGPYHLNELVDRAGLPGVRIIHRLSEPHSPEENLRLPQIDFVGDGFVHTLPERTDRPLPRAFPVPGLDVGSSYLDAADIKRDGPTSFAGKNRAPLAVLQRALCMVVRPDVDCGGPGFALDAADRAMLVEAMRELPRESTNPKLGPDELKDDYVKFMLPGFARVVPLERLRVHDKSGQAYGFNLDNAWVVDTATGRSFFLAATIYANADGVLNDDRYDYDTVSLPGLADIAEAVARGVWSEAAPR